MDSTAWVRIMSFAHPAQMPWSLESALVLPWFANICTRTLSSRVIASLSACATSASASSTEV